MPHFSFRVTTERKNEYLRMAEKKGISVAQLIRDYLDSLLDED